MGVLFQYEGFKEARQFLAGAAGRMRDTRTARKFIGEEQLARNQRRIRAGIDVDGKRFTPSRRVQMSGGQTLVDRGRLAASLNYDTPGENLDLYSSDKRARVHWEGREIKPTGGRKFLTIPLRARGGMHSGDGIDIRANRTGARASHFSKKTTFFRWVRGRLFLFQRTEARGIRALFLLVRSVKMPERKWFGFSSEDLEMASQVLGRHVEGEKL